MEHAENAVIELAKYLQLSDTPDRRTVAEGAIWGIAAAVGDDPETVRRMVDEARRRHPTAVDLPETMQDKPTILRTYAPGVYVTREAKVNVADPTTPPAPPNPKAMSAQTNEQLSRPLTEQERLEIETLPEPSSDELAAMVAQVKGATR